MILFIDCAPLPLKFTVLGAELVTFNVPAEMVSVFAIPKTAPVANCNDVPFTITLYKLAVPFNDDVEVNVAVPFDMVSDPDTVKVFDTVKPILPVIVPDEEIE